MFSAVLGRRGAGASGLKNSSYESLHNFRRTDAKEEEYENVRDTTERSGRVLDEHLDVHDVHSGTASVCRRSLSSQ